MSESVFHDRVRLFVDALRSGEYTQGFGTLTWDGRDCCLGVAVKVAIHNGLSTVVEDEDDGRVSYDGEIAVLPLAVRQWYGFSDNNPELSNGEITFSATTWNDDGCANFYEIADMFERGYLPESQWRTPVEGDDNG